MSCAGVCSAQGLSAATLRESSGVLQTTACEVNITGQGKRAGYQEGGHSACSVVADSQINSSSEYSCLCLASSTTPGLAAAQGQSCSTACTQSVEGMTGAPVAVESSETSYLCLPSSEIGKLLAGWYCLVVLNFSMLPAVSSCRRWHNTAVRQLLGAEL